MVMHRKALHGMVSTRRMSPRRLIFFRARSRQRKAVGRGGAAVVANERATAEAAEVAATLRDGAQGAAVALVGRGGVPDRPERLWMAEKTSGRWLSVSRVASNFSLDAFLWRPRRR